MWKIIGGSANFASLILAVEVHKKLLKNDENFSFYGILKTPK